MKELKAQKVLSIYCTRRNTLASRSCIKTQEPFGSRRSSYVPNKEHEVGA